MIANQVNLEKVLIALNGSKESWVTAWLLKKQGMKLRGVFFDLNANEAVSNAIADIEKKLGLSIQVVNVKAEAEEFLKSEVNRSIINGMKIDLKTNFHQNFLFPKLFSFKNQYQFQKVATGHRVLLQHDSVVSQYKVHRYSQPEDDESHLLVGLSQEQLAGLMVPLGSIPSSMIEKIANELQLTDLSDQFDPNWVELRNQAKQTLIQDQTRTANVVTKSGRSLGLFPDYANLEVGDPYYDPEDPVPGREYTVLEIDSQRRKVIVGRLSRRVIVELHVEAVSWFNRKDLGFDHLRCAMLWGRHPKAYAVKLIQFEGFRMKAFLESPISGEDADIFNGQNVLWVNGAEVLGGARVIACIEKDE